MKNKISILISSLILILCLGVGITAYASDSINDCTVSLDASTYTYTGTQITPSVTVTDNGTVLSNGTDYTVSYSDNVNVGKGYVTVSGINNYSGAVTQEFTISSCNIGSDSNISVALEYSSVSYSGVAKKPSVTVKYGSTTLTKGTDYSVSYSDNTNAGTATVTVKGKGNFSGQNTKTFKIKKLDITKKSKYTVTFKSSSLVYKNSKVTPVMTITYDTGEGGVKTLVQGVDYKVSYSNNNAPGLATAKITGLTNYTGSFTKNFYIIPSKVTGVKATASSSSVTVKWTKLSKVTGYEILVYNSSKKSYTHLAYVSSKYSSYTASNLSTGTTYRYKVRAYKTVNSKKYYGSYSKAASAVIKPSRVSVTAVSMSGSSLTVKWKKVTGSGYQIFYSTDKNMKKNVKSVFVSSKKSSYTIKNLSSSKTYYVKVRAYKNYNSKKRYGQKSAVSSNNYTNVYATYSSNYVSNANRTNNLTIASKAISGTIIAPGETFNFNSVVGARTAAKGYKAAPVFTGSTGVSDQLGGGICQVASTMFNCALKANVTITERHQHSQRVSYVPLGRDAAISGSSKNFQFTNNTKYSIKIKMTVSGGVITCTFYTCVSAKPAKVSLNVTQSGNSFTLKRSVGGTVNYTAYSNY